MKPIITVSMAMFLSSLAVTSPALSEALPDGSKTIKLVEFDGKEHIVGSIEFKTKEAASTYQISWKDEVFGEHFLSMRPFKCFEGPAK